MEFCVPASLEAFVVEQDYARYDAADQATWRFVLLHLHDHLKAHAHASYTRGLFETGLDIEKIPRIEDVHRALQAFGWGAVCVSGFIPPRAFQAFQAAGVLPIAAEVRDPQHVAYTPAPDIIHEAAGHAPILVNDAYAKYLRRIGAVGQAAFSNPEDVEVYRAIAHLSAVKEQPAAMSNQLQRASERLQAALAAQTGVSEATRIARLYWWTAEYGLIGEPHDYRLYGAGLLSSLGEAVFSRDSAVAKYPLSIACLDVDYDITQPQPQLFVARDFDHLLDVLAQAEATLATHRSIRDAARMAIASRLPAIIVLSDGGNIRDRITALLGEDRLIALVLETHGILPVGPHSVRGPAIVGQPVSLEYATGAAVTGTLERIEASSWTLQDARVVIGAQVLPVARQLILPRTEIVAIRPGDDLGVFDSPRERRRAPLVPTRTSEQQKLRALYERAYAAWRDRAGTQVVEVFAAIHRGLEAFPDDWLLRWNLLESLIKLGASDQPDLVEELETLEVRFAHRQPIATGLRSLRRLGYRSQEMVS